MRRTFRFAAVATGALALVTGVVSGAGAAPGAANADPSNVTLSWANGQIAVSWSDTAAVEHWIYVSNQGSPRNIAAGSAPAGQSTFALNRDAVPSNAAQAKVCVVAGPFEDPASPEACSAEFDAFHAGWGRITSATPSFGNSLTFTWTAPAPPTDNNPGDPLDVDAPPTYRLTYHEAWPGGWGDLDGARTPGTVVLNDAWRTDSIPADAWGVRAENEWGLGVNPSYVALTRPDVGVNIPTYGTYGDSLRVTGTYDARGPMMSEIGVTRPTGGDDLIQLQAAPSTTSTSWSAVQSLRPTAYQSYTVSGTTLKPQAYRVATKPWSVVTPYGFYAQFGTISVPKMSYVKAKVNSATVFNGPTYPTTVRAHISVSPGLGGAARLQRLVGSTWTNVKDVAMVNGVGDYVFSRPSADSTWRFVISGRNAPDGTWISSTTTTSFRIAGLSRF